MNDRYDITKLITKDFAGGLYEGLDKQLDRKIICRRFFNEHGDQSDTSWHDAFTEYCHSLTAMNHPNIASVLDAGIDEDGAFLITQLVDGASIGDLLLDHPFEEHEVHSLAHDVLDAFIMIHGNNETHGALVPKSIVRKDKPGGRFSHHIVDQGIANIVPMIQGQPLDLKNPALTSPEQLQGETPTPQSDLFMLGQLLYTLAAQGHPFSAESIEDTIQLHLDHQQTPLVELAPHISPGLAQWIHGLIHPDPNQRPASAEEAAKTLPLLVAQQPGTPPQTEVPAVPQVTQAIQTTAPALVTGTVAQSITAPQAQTTTGLHPATTSTTLQSGTILASQKISNKPVIFSAIGLGAVIIAILLYVVFGHHTTPEVKPDEEETAAKKTEDPKPQLPPRAVINSVKKLTDFSKSARSKPIQYHLSDSSLLDYAILHKPDTSQFLSHSNNPYISDINKTKGAKLWNDKVSNMPITFTLDSGRRYFPNSGASLKTKLQPGAGYDIKLYSGNNAPKELYVNIVLTQMHTELNCAVIESETGQDESQLTSKTISNAGEVTQNIPVTLKNLKANHYYIIRLTCQNASLHNKALIGLNAVTISKGKQIQPPVSNIPHQKNNRKIHLFPENAITQDKGLRIEQNTSDNNAPNIGFWTSKNEFLEFPFNIHTAGKYTIYATLATPDRSGGDMQISVDGKKTITKISSTGGWKKYKKVKIGEISFHTTGNKLLTIKALHVRGQGFLNLRSVELTPVN